MIATDALFALPEQQHQEETVPGPLPHDDSIMVHTTLEDWEDLGLGNSLQLLDSPEPEEDDGQDDGHEHPINYLGWSSKGDKLTGALRRIEVSQSKIIAVGQTATPTATGFTIVTSNPNNTPDFREPDKQTNALTPSCINNNERFAAVVEDLDQWKAPLSQVTMDPTLAKFERLSAPLSHSGLRAAAKMAARSAGTQAVKPARRRPVRTAVYCLLLIAGTLAVLWLADRSNAERTVSNAIAMTNNGNADQAIRILSDALVFQPNDGRFHLYRGLALAENGDVTKGLADLSSALQHGADKPVVLMARAGLELRTKDYDRAIEDCTTVLFDSPLSIDALQIRASCWMHKGDFRHATRDLTTALRTCTDPHRRARLSRERGFAEAKNGLWQQAIDDLSSALKVNPSAWSYLQRSEVYRAHNMLEKALSDCDAAGKIDPRSYAMLVERGICLADLHRDAEALQDFSQALEIDASGVEALIQRGNVHLRNQHWDLAQADFQRAVYLNPAAADAQACLMKADNELEQPIAVPGSKQ